MAGIDTESNQMVSYMHVPERHQQQQDRSSNHQPRESIIPSIETPKSIRFHDLKPGDGQNEIIVLDSPQDKRNMGGALLYARRETAPELHDQSKRRKIESKNGPVVRLDRHREHLVRREDAVHEFPYARNRSVQEVSHGYHHYDDQRREVLHPDTPRADHTHTLSGGLSASHPQILLSPKQDRFNEVSRVSSAVALPRSHVKAARDLPDERGSYVLREIKDRGQGVKTLIPATFRERSIHEHANNTLPKRNGRPDVPTYVVESPTNGRILHMVRGSGHKSDIDPTVYMESRDGQLERIEPPRIRRDLPLDRPLPTLNSLPGYGTSGQADQPMIVHLTDERERSKLPYHVNPSSRDFQSEGWGEAVYHSRDYRTYERAVVFAIDREDTRSLPLKIRDG